MRDYQSRVHDWLLHCFDANVAADRTERNYRFLEEALELVQASGGTQNDAHKLVDYVFGRPKGMVHLEIGGVMVCLAALCNAHFMDMKECGDIELDRNWTRSQEIHKKWLNKSIKSGPLP